MARLAQVSAALALFLVLASCGKGTTVAATDYDRLCEADAECALVYVGDVCGCSCTQDGVAVTAVEKVAKDREEARKSCDAVAKCQPCQDSRVAYCLNTTCAVRPR